jgi:radical SAM superfamily enzyme YgiQ (UPF0313 family)
MTADVILLTCLSGSLWQRSIGAYQLAGYLRQNGYIVQVIDFTDYFSNEELVSTVERFVGENTKILGVSSTFYQSVKPEKNIKDNKDYSLGAIGLLPDNIINSVKTIKEKYPHIKTAVGGGHSSIFENTDLFDIVVYGYAEEVFLEYLKTKRIYPKINNSLILNGDDYKFDIEHLQHTWTKEDCVLPNETLPIEISRGCIFKCKFCGYPLNGKKKFDYLRDPSMIVDELQENYERYGTTNYLFADDTFNDSTYKLEQLHKKIAALPFKINFTTYLRLDLLYSHREQLQLLKELGLKSAFFGIESLNEKTAKFIGKGMSPSKVKDFLLELKNDIWQDDISMLCTFIVGLPYEDIASTDQSFEWIQLAGINSAWTPLYIHTTHRYKSDIAINYEKYGYNILDHDLGTWTTDTLSWEQANIASTRYNTISMPNNYVSSWILFSLLSYGLHSVDQLMKIQNKDFPVELYRKQHSNLFLEYKNLLLNLN